VGGTDERGRSFGEVDVVGVGELLQAFDKGVASEDGGGGDNGV